MSLPVVRPHFCEPLESRIAPSVFFVSPSSLAINKNGKNNAAALDLTAATTAGATAALLLHKGDTLVFDLNNDGKFDSGDTLLLKVSAGQAMAFLTDTGDGAGGASDAKFEANELTGLAVSDGFTGLGSDVHGTVATALKADGTFSADNIGITLQHASIKGLTLTGGVIGGALLAGGSISNVTTTALPHTVPAGVSVTGMVATGDLAGSQQVSFNGGGKTGFTFAAGISRGEAGGDITNVRVASAAGIATGDGADGTGYRAGGSGGSISGLVVEDLTGSFSIATGHGGAGQNGNGGAGGSFTGSTVYFHPASAADQPAIVLGAGGGSLNGSGGAGGSFVKSDFAVKAAAASFTLTSGAGGASEAGSGPHANGGNGGAMSAVTVETMSLSGNLLLQSGAGGSSAIVGSAGGSGGAITALHVTTGVTTGNLTISAGSGGQGFLKGGSGGTVSGLTQNSDLFGNLTIGGGQGGTANGSKGVGGAGGAILSSDVMLTGGATGDVIVRAGDGNFADTVAGGRGGAVSKFSLEIVSQNPVAGAVKVVGGVGGALVEADGRIHHAADGGAVIGVSILDTSALGSLDIASGDGGSSFLGSGSAGNGGKLSKITLTSKAPIGGSAQIHSGSGGSGGLQSQRANGPGGPTGYFLGIGNGGNSGDVSAVRVDDWAGGSTPFEIYAGVPVASTGGPKTSGGMTGFGAASHGGSIGSVSGISLNPDAAHDSSNSHFIIGKADAAGSGGGDPESHGGNGGSISGVTGLVGTLDILAPAGGDGFGQFPGGPDSFGVGGTGGSISGINVTTSGAGHFVHLIAAGDGGAGSMPGAGGSVTKVKVAGDIGNVTGSFNLSTDESGMGGLVAGLGGAGDTDLNGSISGINVGTHTIAAILAGRPAANGITVANAVTKISGIVAGKIGADNGTIGIFDYMEGSSSDTAFQPNSTNTTTDGDTALDGLVIVNKGGSVLPVAPLLLVEV